MTAMEKALRAKGNVLIFQPTYEQAKRFAQTLVQYARHWGEVKKFDVPGIPFGFDMGNRRDGYKIVAVATYNDWREIRYIRSFLFSTVICEEPAHADDRILEEVERAEAPCILKSAQQLWIGSPKKCPPGKLDAFTRFWWQGGWSKHHMNLTDRQHLAQLWGMFRPEQVRTELMAVFDGSSLDRVPQTVDEMLYEVDYLAASMIPGDGPADEPEAPERKPMFRPPALITKL